MCVFPIDDLPCGAIDNLQFHEAFGEASDGRMQQRILLCDTHHDTVHGAVYDLEPSDNYKYSVVCDDIAIEQYLYDGTEKWAKHFEVDLARFGILWKLSETQGSLRELLG